MDRPRKIFAAVAIAAATLFATAGVALAGDYGDGGGGDDSDDGHHKKHDDSDDDDDSSSNGRGSSSSDDPDDCPSGVPGGPTAAPC
jgi:hypothetical protein